MAVDEDRPVMRAQEGLPEKEERDRLPVRYGIVGGSVEEHALASCGIPPNKKAQSTHGICTTKQAPTSDFLDSVSKPSFLLLEGAFPASTLFLFVRGSPSALSTACRFETAEPDGPK